MHLIIASVNYLCDFLLKNRQKKILGRPYAEGKAVGVAAMPTAKVVAPTPCYAEAATPTAAVGIACADGFMGYADGCKPSA